MFLNRKYAKIMAATITVTSLFFGGAAAHAAPIPSLSKDSVTGQSSESALSAEAAAEPVTLYARAASGAVLGCKGAYDNPHPSKSSGYKKINAHLTVKCEGQGASKIKIEVKSRMFANVTRPGLLNTKTGNGTAKTGGDLSCTTKTEGFRASGSYKVTWPAGYKPLTSSYSKISKTMKFKLATSGAKKGQCIPA